MKTVLVGVLFVCSILRAEALVISEIMYNPEGINGGRYWIEVFNDTGSAVNLTTWRFFEDNVNHGIAESQGGSSLPAGAYAVIADNTTKFKTDYPDYQGILYDSSFSLLTTGESLSLKETSSASPAFTVDYTPYVSLGGDNDGSTLSRVSSSWVRGRATPGAENAAEEKIITAEATSTSAGGQMTVAQMSPPSPDIILYMPSGKIAVAGAESELRVSGMTRAGKPIDDLRFTWAFGDGGRGAGSSTRHTYVYNGRYVAQVEGSNSYVAGTGRTIVRVVPPDISIADVGQGKYGAYVDVNNPNAYELDVSGWAISIDGAVYPFPQNTIIASNMTTRFAGASMGFAKTAVRESTIFKIQFPNLEEVTRYVPRQKERVPVLVASTTIPATVAYVPTKVVTNPTPTQKRVLGVSTSTQPQAVTTSTPVKKTTTKDTRLVAWFRSLFGR